MKHTDPITAEGYCRGGVIEWRTAWRFIKAAVTNWPDGPVVFTLAQKEETRRGRANRWLFGVVYKLMLLEMQGRATERDKWALHEWMALRFNPIRITDPFTGEDREVGGPTRTMSVERFSQFVEDVMLFGSEKLGIIWPEPRQSEDWRTDRKAAA